MTTTNDKQRDRKLEEIAETQLGIPTLDSRKSDRLDFHEVSVWGLHDALAKAYEAGQKTGPLPTTAPCPRCGSDVTIHRVTT